MLVFESLPAHFNGNILVNFKIGCFVKKTVVNPPGAPSSWCRENPVPAKIAAVLSAGLMSLFPPSWGSVGCRFCLPWGSGSARTGPVPGCSRVWAAGLLRGDGLGWGKEHPVFGLSTLPPRGQSCIVETKKCENTKSIQTIFFLFGSLLWSSAKQPAQCVEPLAEFKGELGVEGNHKLFGFFAAYKEGCLYFYRGQYQCQARMPGYVLTDLFKRKKHF